VNGKIVDIPSFNLKPGNTVGVREKSKSLQSISSSLEANSSIYEWMTWNSSTHEGNFVSIPQRNQIPENIKEQLIVELYSK
jgi:small subunit ribosomal protein S4